MQTVAHDVVFTEQPKPNMLKESTKRSLMRHQHLFVVQADNKLINCTKCFEISKAHGDLGPSQEVQIQFYVCNANPNFISTFFFTQFSEETW